MRSVLRAWRLFSRRSLERRPAVAVRPLLERLEDRLVPSSDFVQTNLVSDVPGLATVTDPNLVNAWGLTASSTSPFWVSNQGSGTSTLYNGQGQPQPAANPLIVNIPANPADNPPLAHGSPTGDVFNNGGSTAFDLTAGDPKTSAIFL